MTTIPPAKTYLGQRTPDETGTVVIVRHPDGDERLLHQVVHHSPNGGFEWGYSGSGPADLALSILEDYFAEETKPIKVFRGRCGTLAWQLHQAFKWQIIAGLAYERWEITADHIAAWLAVQPGYAEVIRQSACWASKQR